MQKYIIEYTYYYRIQLSTLNVWNSHFHMKYAISWRIHASMRNFRITVYVNLLMHLLLNQCLSNHVLIIKSAANNGQHITIVLCWPTFSFLRMQTLHFRFFSSFHIAWNFQEINVIFSQNKAEFKKKKSIVPWSCM